jgi:hypothetical protein
VLELVWVCTEEIAALEPAERGGWRLSHGHKMLPWAALVFQPSRYRIAVFDRVNGDC